MARYRREVFRFTMFMIAMTACLSLYAVPAKRGIWKTITIDDGTRVHAELRGDEHGHVLIDRNGNTYAKNERNTYSLVKEDEPLTPAIHRPSFAHPRRLNGIPTDKSTFQGKKKGIVILVQFPAGSYTENGETTYEEAVTFSEETPALLGCTTTKELYEKIINQRDLGNDPLCGPFTGSVKDYFIDQSHGQFELDFDVAGPYTLSHCHHYYGANNASDNDSHPGEMVYEAASLALADGIDFSQYDWDGDNVVDQVFVLYAGQGEADGGSEDCVWPHEYYLAYAYQAITTTIDGKQITINQYACSNELATNGKYESGTDNFIVNGTQIAGIGTFCHEFSHCIGYPDMYDIAYENYGMGQWDLMDEGTYNGTWNGGHDDWEELRAGYQPAGFTAFEKWCAGWVEPVVLDEPQKVTDIKPVRGDNGGNAYVVYMPGSAQSIEGEYYLIENRQQEGWDTSLPWHGLLVTYVHYDQALWRNNCLNCTNEQKLKSRHATNTHPRMTVFQAGGSDPGFLSLDAYPYRVDSLTQLLGSNWGTTGSEIATNLNNRYAAKGLCLNLDDNDALTEGNSPAPYYWGSGATPQDLTDHELWAIEENGDDQGSMTFIYRTLDQDNVLTLDQDTPQPQQIETGLYSSATINRQFTPAIYNTLWLPFNMNVQEVRSCWGEGAEVYRLTDVTENDEGKYVLNITEDTRNGIRAYEPILIKMDEDGSPETTAFNHYIQVNEAIGEHDPLVETANGWKMVGTTERGYVPAGAKYLVNNKYFTAEENRAVIRAYRAYFVAPGNDSLPTNDVKEVVFNIINHEQQGTGIILPSTRAAHATNQGITYDLTGRKVEATHLRKGIYIRDGKKYIQH